MTKVYHKSELIATTTCKLLSQKEIKAFVKMPPSGWFQGRQIPGNNIGLCLIRFCFYSTPQDGFRCMLILGYLDILLYCGKTRNVLNLM